MVLLVTQIGSAKAFEVISKEEELLIPVIILALLICLHIEIKELAIIQKLVHCPLVIVINCFVEIKLGIA